MRTSLLLLPLLAFPANAAEPVNAEYFEKKVRPLLLQHCTTCHGKEKQKGELRLDSREAMLKGGDNGPSVKPGDPDKSLLIKAIRYTDADLKMPKKAKLSDAEIEIFTEWVKGGAPWPAGGTATPTGPGDKFDLQARAKAHWSFQPIANPPVPAVANAKTPIDAFLLAKLNAAGLSFSSPADKRTLIRRAKFDLTGLPPTPPEIDAFLKDDSPQAFEKVVDRLLASPHYGERQARHWLDLVRYAETHGHEFDFEIPDAWRYRDYVVRAMNADVPYNQFLTENIAGDLIAKPRRNPKDGSNESLTGTGFWWLGEGKHSPVDSRVDYAERTDNQIDVFGKTVLGLTLGCARCHDHKFDPVATKDYYSLFAVVASSRFQRADANDPEPVAKLLDEIAELKGTPKAADPARSPAGIWREKAVSFEQFGDGWRDRWDASGLALRPEAGPGLPHSGRESRKLTGALRSPTFIIEKNFTLLRVAGRDAKVRFILNGIQLIQSPIYGGLAQTVNHGEELRWIGFDTRMWKGQPAYIEILDDGPGYFAVSEAWHSDTHPASDPAPKVPLWDPGAADAKIVAKITALEAKIPDPKRVPAARDGTGRNEKVFIRGNPKTLGADAPRAFLEAFGGAPFESKGSGRLELAKAVTDPKNTLTARVIVNRLWQHHFGEGIVRTPDDFGYQGQRPTHPELLDWLATEFMKNDWSLKKMHRTMLLSAAYQQSSHASAEASAKAATADPQNKLLHRQNVQRLEAEAIRDAMLAVSGRLDRTMEGPGVLPYLTEHQVGRGRPASGPLDGNGRRSLYLQVRRNFLNPFFVAFDYPTPFTTIGRRTVSNVPAQALSLLNNPFVIQQADLWAKRTTGSPEDRVKAMYTAAFGRPPSADEIETATAFIREAGPGDKAWADLAHVLFNAKEFIFVE
ncbi:MAG: PSD1 and planctomycete cytochrome C domain-containing protein [Gemmataceae bacterium]